MANPTTPGDVINFWFNEIESSMHFKKDPQFDATIAERFGETHRAASQCELESWRETASGRLAEVIVLDQFSRNLFRDDPKAFAQDPLALALAQAAISAGADRELNASERGFLYMPFMHSESLVIHDRAVQLFSQPGHENTLKYEHQHRDIIAKFGRYPHRNKILNRESTPEEIEFLSQPGSSF